MSLEVKRSDHNPFRTPPITPDVTGAGPSSSVNTPPLSSPQPQQNPLTTGEPSASARRPQFERTPSPSTGLAEELQATTLDETPLEPPPAYTPSANSYQGEATVELGPRRPFQQAPYVPPVSQQLTGISQYSSYLSPQVTGLPLQHNPTGAWGQYPGQAVNYNNQPQQNFYTPPPQHIVQQAQTPSPIRVSGSNTGEAPLSDFAIDFYASGSSMPQPGRSSSPVLTEESSVESSRPEHYERVRPSSHSSPGGSASPYAPPPGPPPSAPSSPSSHTPPTGPPPTHPSRVPSNNDDWRPTTSPTPGRPLLNKGRVLLYPPGYNCKKCKYSFYYFGLSFIYIFLLGLNTGYKRFDPSHPCKKCWEKHSKPYSGAILCAPRSDNFQKPLPNLRPPHMRHNYSQSQPSLLSPPGRPANTRPNSDYRPSSFTENTYRPSCASIWPQQNLSPPPIPPRMPQPRPFGFQPLMPRVTMSRGMPPPGATIVKPGDSRIGGRLCWRCGGSGTVSYMIFDSENCSVCNGIGRVFN